MEDKLTLERAKEISPELYSELSLIIKESNKALTGRAILRLAYVFRSFIEQTFIYAQGRTRPGLIVTNAKAGQSIHNYRYAVDIVLLKDTNGDGTFETASWETNVDFDGDGKADWMEIVAIFQKYGWQWGLINKKGQRYDLPHFQKSPMSLKELQFKYPKGR